MRFSDLASAYLLRLRHRTLQELLAACGIAVGVALVFATLVANQSITSSSREIINAIRGNATLQLEARGQGTFSERTVGRVEDLKGVSAAAGVYDVSGRVVSRGRASEVEFVSASTQAGRLGGIAAKIPLQQVGGGVLISSALAKRLGMACSSPVQHLEVQIRGHTVEVPITAVLGRETIGAVSDAMVVLAPTWVLQRLARVGPVISRVLVTPGPGSQGAVRRELTGLAGSRYTVASADEDIALLGQATKPNSHATSFFALVAGFVGLLIVFNVVLLTVPERREFASEKLIDGYRRPQLAQFFLFQAICLGLVASAAGVLLGAVVAKGLLRESPAYLVLAFPIGTQTVIRPWTAIAAFGGGVAVACLGIAPVLLELRRPLSDVVQAGENPGHALNGRSRRLMLLAGVALAAVTSAVALLAPSLMLLAPVGLASAILLVTPAIFAAFLGGAERVASTTPWLNRLLDATLALRATSIRSLVLAATGAIAVFGSVVVQGVRSDLLHGLYHDYGEYVASSDIWVTAKGDELATSSFSAPGLPKRIAQIPGVTGVRRYQGGFLDVAGRRVWVIARTPPGGAIPPGQAVKQIPGASRLIAQGDGAALSEQLAESLGVHLGSTVTLPTPAGSTAYRVAAVTTNLGWSSGAIVFGNTGYQRGWGSSDPTALEVDVRHSEPAVLARIRGMLDGSLRVQTSSARAATADAVARNGLSRLSQITWLLIVAAAVAMAGAMGAAIWERRSALADGRLDGRRSRQLQIVLAHESLIVLLAGCGVGAIVGVYGHFLGDRYLQRTTGFPIIFSPQVPETLRAALLVIAAAGVVLAIPGFVAARAPFRLALDNQ